MTAYSAIFYLLSALIIVSTGIAITRRNMVHVVIYLVFSFFFTAMLFYLLGAPFLAAMEVIVYAGAIMVLFLFIIMMIDVSADEFTLFPLKQWVPATALFGSTLILGALLLFADTSADKPMQAAMAPPWQFGHYLFQWHWLSIELVSVLLLVALIGAFILGKPREKASDREMT